MNRTTHLCWSLCVTLLVFVASAHAANEQTHNYKGTWRGKPVLVTIIWEDFGGTAEFEGTIYDRVGRKAHTIQGINLRPGFIEFDFADDNYKLTSEIKNGQIIWSGGPGDSLTFSRTAPKGVAGGGGGNMKPITPHLPTDPINIPQPLPQPQPVQNLTINPIIWPVGKWPEGITFDGEHFWVCESGVRTLVQLDGENGTVRQRVTSGRLPVGIVGNTLTRTVIAAVATDQKLIKFDSSGKGGNFVTLPDYPQDIAADDTSVYVLMHIDGNSSTSQVAHYDPFSGAKTMSPVLGLNTSDVFKAGKWLWVSHGTPPTSTLDIMDPATLDMLPSIPLAGHLSSLAGNETAVFVAGGEWDVTGEIVRVDAEQMRETHRQPLAGEFIYCITADSDHVVAIGYHGTIWMMDAHDLRITKVIRLSWGNYTPAAVMMHGESLFITTHRGDGDNGSVLKVPNVIDAGHP